tara:strand:- start:154 stop:1383 length:1230 start_codon:yes stop_codon:yes gene_type:complete
MNIIHHNRHTDDRLSEQFLNRQKYVAAYYIRRMTGEDFLFESTLVQFNRALACRHSVHNYERVNFFYTSNVYSCEVVPEEAMQPAPNECSFVLGTFGQIYRFYSNPNLTLLNGLLNGAGIAGLAGLDNEAFSTIVENLPSGSLALNQSMLSCDSLGFRLRERATELAPESTVDILVFGGSHAASVYSLPGESFTDHLERLVTSRLPKGHRARVINLSQGSVVQATNASHFLNFGLRFRPRVVVFYDGLNDLSCGAYSDRVLSEGFGLLYGGHVSAGKPPQVDRLNARQVVEAYVNYRVYLTSILKDFGVNTVSVLQPMQQLSGVLNERESVLADNYLSGWSLYSTYPQSAAMAAIIMKMRGLNVLDFHASLSDGDEKIEFWDCMHQAPESEFMIAEHMLEPVWEALRAF